MFEENENLVTDVTENVEQATEELVDGAKGVETTEQSDVGVATETLVAETFTKEQVDEMIAKKLARKEAKIRKEYDKKYGRLESVLKAGTGVDDLEQMTNTFTDFYTQKGIQIPTIPEYSQRDMEYLAERDANEIIEGGYEEIKDELNRMTEIGFDNMSKSDKIIFLKLKKEADKLTNEKELKSIGITELPSDFKDFSDKLNPNLSMKEKYDMYTKLNPKKKVEQIGSMKSVQMNKVKDYYTSEEIERLTLDELNDPKVWEAVRKSMTGQN